MRACAVALLVVGALLAPRPGHAHPMGNFSISHYAEIRVDAEKLELRYLIDMAEIPTFQEIQDTGLVPEISHESVKAYVPRTAEALRAGLHVEVNSRRIALETVSTDVLFPPGAGGLPTMKLGAVYRAKLADPPGTALHDLRYRDTNFPDRAGWKEIVAREGRDVVFVSSSASANDRSRQLADYPTDPLSSPPQDLEARVVFARQPGEPRLASIGSAASSDAAPPPAAAPEPVTRDTAVVTPLVLQANRQGTPRSPLTQLITTERLSLGIILIALAVAAGLGAFHALEPGHGKTLVAAYLVGSRGTAWHAVLLGLIVTVAHTSAVYLLGGVTLYASQYVVPERLYPWLGLISGLAVAGVGVSLLLRRARHDGHHHHGHDHHHHPHDHHGHDHHGHDHGHDHDHAAGGAVSVTSLLALGVTGGIVPCPAALVVLLSAVSLHRIGFGLLLIVAFSAGLAAVLIGVGLVMVYGQRFLSRAHAESVVVTRWLPLTSSVVITLTGLALTVQALAAAGVVRLRL